MESAKILIYDGSFNGFLTTVYKAFEQSWKVADIKKMGDWNDDLFVNTESIKTDTHLAKQVWNGIAKKNNVAIKRIYFSFLSEQQDIELLLFKYILFIMERLAPDAWNELPETIDMLNSLVGKVEKEKRRMEVFAQFQLAKENSDYVHLKPKYNILPLLSKHLRQTEKGKHWQVFDDKRKYGIGYSFGRLEIVSNISSVA